MIISVELNKQTYKIDTNEPLDISIPLAFGGAQPNVYGVENATSKACEAGDLIGDTRRGGSVNFEQYTFIPHCNGTHTECVGHITHQRISIGDCLKDTFIPATLVSVEPEMDEVISRKSLENIFTPLLTRGFLPSALIVRTLPNDESKKSRVYSEENIPPFFSTEAMEFIVDQRVEHLLVDLPSIDRIFDEGKLSNHRLFWNVEAGAFETNEKSRFNNTITELIFVPDEIADGDYLLNLQIAPFASDATPSRPILFKLI